MGRQNESNSKKDRIRKTTKKSKLHLLVIAGIFLLAFIVLIIRMAYWSLGHGKEFELDVLGQQKSSSVEVPFQRGSILDSKGRILATNENYYKLILEPANILLREENEKGEEEYRDTTLEVLHEYLDLDQDEVLEFAKKHKESYYNVYLRDLTYSQVKELKDFLALAKKKTSDGKTKEEKEQIRKSKKVVGVYFEEEYHRIYPNNELACQLIGFTSNGTNGVWGIESSYNSELNGVNGRTFSYIGEDNTVETTTKDPIDGNSVVTTINLEVQKIIEKYRSQFDENVGSENTMITVMDPNNGEILGLTTSYPYNLNEPSSDSVISQKYSQEDIALFAQNQEKEEKGENIGRYEKENRNAVLTTNDAFNSIWKNAAITDTYEPGSTFKPFTVAGALEEGIYDGTESFYCTGSKRVGKWNIACSHVHENLEFKDIIAKSCNSALMEIGLKEGKDVFLNYQNIFNFGKKTGVDLPNEGSGILYDEETMTDVDLATNSFGQNFTVTNLQMITAFSSIINGGYYYKPHVVKQIVDKNGSVVKNIEKTCVKRTVSEDVSEQMRGYLQETVLSGTAKGKADVKGYTVGGKTGTAEKLPRDKTNYLVSFIAFAPVEDPQVVIYVTIDQPHVDFQANAGLAIEVEQKCMKEILPALEVQKSNSKKTK